MHFFYQQEENPGLFIHYLFFHYRKHKIQALESLISFPYGVFLEE